MVHGRGYVSEMNHQSKALNAAQFEIRKQILLGFCGEELIIAC